MNSWHLGHLAIASLLPNNSESDIIYYFSSLGRPGVTTSLNVCLTAAGISPSLCGLVPCGLCPLHQSLQRLDPGLELSILGSALRQRLDRES